jgi:hypothetical protein
MSLLRNLAGDFVPIRESRKATGTLIAANSEVVLDLNGDDNFTMWLDGSGATLNATYGLEGSVDGAVYFPLLSFYYLPAFNGGTAPVAAQPFLTEAVNAASLRRVICAPVGGLAKVRVRLTAWTAGTADVILVSDNSSSLVPYIRDQKAATLMLTATGASGAAVTGTVPLVAGLRHYFDRISVVKFAAATLTAAATPVLVTTTNIVGSPVLSFGAAASAQGTYEEQLLDFSGSGMAATAVGTNTTIVCPATTGVIWRINAAYRLGL